ncbi:MAG: HAMP domain-containing sensor histidine kinase [Cyanobacteria bacterium P01_D01_bin.1]
MSKPRLLLLLSNNENKRLLVDRLAADFEIVLIGKSLEDNDVPDIDLIICNLIELGRWCEQVSHWRRTAEPVLLPVLAFMPRNTVGALPNDVRYQIDELVTVPIDPDELDVRISLLLRSRRLSAELARQNQKLEELNAFKTRFVSIVSHEFRNPLSVISSITQLLQVKEKQYSAEKRQDLLQRMSRVVTKLTALIDDLLLLSRNTSSQTKFNPQTVNLQQHCQTLIDNFQLSTAENRSIQLQAQGELSSVSLDLTLVNTILSNLLSNAIKYSPETAPVRLTIERIEDQVVLQVTDQGQGIPLEDQPALFDAFFRARNVGSIQGTGLGLSILKQCVDLHNGAVEVDSHMGQGTTFTVMLPCTLSYS